MPELHAVADRFRLLAFRALSWEGGDKYRPVRLVRQVLGTANDLVGRPLCSEDELARRHARRASAQALARAARTAAAATAHAAREAAPVMVYFDGQDHRTLKKVEELLKARDVPWKTLDVTDDEATRSWARTSSPSGEFPLVFIAGEAVGGLHELTQLDVNGALKKRVFGA